MDLNTASRCGSDSRLYIEPLSHRILCLPGIPGWESCSGLKFEFHVSKMMSVGLCVRSTSPVSGEGVTALLCLFRCDSPEKLKSILPRLEQELKDGTKFKDFYQFTFNFAKNPTQKGLGKQQPGNGLTPLMLPSALLILSLF